MTLRARRAANLQLVKSYFEAKERERRREELASLDPVDVIAVAERIIAEGEAELRETRTVLESIKENT